MRWSHEIIRFPNGLRLALAPMPETAGVSLGAWLAVGSRHEPARLNGISHFIEHLLFKGTRRRSARAIAEAVEGGGGTSDAYTQEDFHLLLRAGPRRAAGRDAGDSGRNADPTAVRR